MLQICNDIKEKEAGYMRNRVNLKPSNWNTSGAFWTGLPSLSFLGLFSFRKHHYFDLCKRFSFRQLYNEPKCQRLYPPL
jgi:hypothetical protein